MDIYWKEYEDVHREWFQRKLYRIRLCLGLSSKEFGNLVGVSRQQVNNVESGRTKLRKPLYLAMMVALLEYVDDDVLFILSHDNGYTYGSIRGAHHATEQENGEWMRDW